MTEPLRRRLFLAVALDDETRALLRAHLAAHGLADGPGRTVAPSNWHVTLRFLGWTADPQRDQILRHLDESDLPSPFRLRFGGLGAFPKPRRATVSWIGVVDGVAALESLAAACEDAALVAGFRPEERPYHPHLTVSRIRPAVDLTRHVETFPAFDVAMGVDAITLFESRPQRGGAVYRAVDRIEL